MDWSLCPVIINSTTTVSGNVSTLGVNVGAPILYYTWIMYTGALSGLELIFWSAGLLLPVIFQK